MEDVRYLECVNSVDVLDEFDLSESADSDRSDSIQIAQRNVLYVIVRSERGMD